MRISATETEAINCMRRKRKILPVNYKWQKNAEDIDGLQRLHEDDEVVVVSESDDEEQQVYDENGGMFEVNFSPSNSRASISGFQTDNEGFATTDMGTQTSTALVDAEVQTDVASRSTDVATQTDFPTNSCGGLAVICKQEQSAQLLMNTIIKLNQRIGDEVVRGSDSEISDGDTSVGDVEEDHFSDDTGPDKHFDNRFAARYGFSTNVRSTFKYFTYCKTKLIFFFQNNGDRYYLNGLVKLRLGEVDILKKWNEAYPFTTQDHDAKFISYMLDLVFGRKTLMRCSAHGRAANNVKVTHEALDPEKLRFVKSMCVSFCTSSIFHIIHYFILQASSNNALEEMVDGSNALPI